MLATEKSVNPLPVAESQETTIYHVQNQDTLCRIAVNHNTTTSNLMKLNRLTSTLIFPGQVLLVPQQNDQNEENKEPSNVDLPCPIANTIDDAYAFLSPLSASHSSVSDSVSASQKLFKDLSVVSSTQPEPHAAIATNKTRKIAIASEKMVECNALHINPDIVKKSAITLVTQDSDPIYNGLPHSRTLSIESCASEPFEENFLKLNVHYLTNVLEHVHGILLITPTSIMFDPDPTCPLALEHGCEKFGVMVDLKKVTTLTMYNDKGYAVEENKSEFSPLPLEDAQLSNGVDNTTKDNTAVPCPSAPTSDSLDLEHDFVSIRLSETTDSCGLREVKIADNKHVDDQTSSNQSVSTNSGAKERDNEALSKNSNKKPNNSTSDSVESCKKGEFD